MSTAISALHANRPTIRFRTEQVACVPLRTDNHVIGVLEAINKQTGRFDHADLFLLEALEVRWQLRCAMPNYTIQR